MVSPDPAQPAGHRISRPGQPGRANVIAGANLVAALAGARPDRVEQRLATGREAMGGVRAGTRCGPDAAPVERSWAAGRRNAGPESVTHPPPDDRDHARRESIE